MAKKDRNTGSTMRMQGIMALGIALWGFFFTSMLTAETARPQSQSNRLLPDQVNVGFTTDRMTDADPKDAKAAMKVWMNIISKKRAGVEKVEMLNYPDLTSMMTACNEKRIDLLFLSSDEYFQMKGRVPFQPVITSTPLKGTTNEFLVLVRRDRGILRLGELINKNFLMERGDSHSLLYTWLETLIIKEGYPGLADFLPNLKEVKGTSRAVLPVFFGQADSCAAYREAFDTMKELNPQLGKELIPIATSPGYVRGIVCVRQEVLKKDHWLVDEMLSIHKEPQGKQILTLMKIGKLIAFEPDHLATSEALLLEHQSLKMKLVKNK